MIDKNGRLFGKINIIDLLIVLVVIAAGIFVATKMFAPADKDEAVEKNTVIIEWTAVSAPAGSGEAIKDGAPVFEDITNIQLGKVVSVEFSDAYTYMPGPDGGAVKVPNVGMQYITVTTEVEGSLTESGLRVGGVLFCVGDIHTVHFGQASIPVKISGISPAA